MRRFRRATGRLLIATVVCTLAALTIAIPAGAYFTSSGSGTGSVNVATLGSPAPVTASLATTPAGSVVVTWSGVPGPDSQPIDGYFVTESNGTTVSPACGSSPALLLDAGDSTPTLSCTDSGLAGGTYTYTVTAVFASWTSAATSGPVIVPVTVTASSPTITYGDATPTISASYTGLRDGDTSIAGVSCSTGYVSGDPAGTYPTTCSGPSSTADYSSIGYVPGTLTVNASGTTVTVTASSPTITYGDATPTISASYTGLRDGDTSIAGVSCSTGYVSGDPAGTYPTTCSGPSSTADYSSIGYVPGTLTVNASGTTVTVTASSPTITYGDATPTISASYTGLHDGDTSIAGVSCSTGYVSGDPAGTYPTTCSGPSSTADYSSIGYVPGTLTVNASGTTVTVTASSPTITYGDATPTISASYTGLRDGDTSIAGVSCSTGYVSGDPAGTYPTTCSGPSSTADYSSIGYVPGTLTVNASGTTVTVTANSPTITYGDATPTISASYTGLRDGDTSIAGVSCSTGYVSGDPAGTYPTTCSGPSSTADYSSIGYVPGTLTVNASGTTVTVTASSPTITYGDATPTISASYTGLRDGDTSIAGVSCSTGYVSGDPAGTYPTTCSGPSSTADYSSIGYVPGTLTVNASGTTVTVTASSPTITYGDATPTISASYTGLRDGDTSIAGVSCSTGYVSGDPAGTYPTTCSGPSSTADYSSIGYVPGTLTVNASGTTVTVTASSPTITYGDATPTISASYTGLRDGDTSIAGVSCSTGYVSGDPAGTYPTTCSGPSSTADYSSIGYVPGTLTVNASGTTVTVTASSPTITYGDATPTISASYTGLRDGDTSIAGVSCSTGYVSGDPAGTYPTTCSGPSSTADYSSIGYVPGTLTVNASGTTVTTTIPTPATTTATYTVTFDRNNGSGTMPDETYTSGVAQALTPNAFTFAGHTFAGWATTLTGAIAYTNGESITISASVTLYAQWKASAVPTGGPPVAVIVQKAPFGAAVATTGSAAFAGTLATNGSSVTFKVTSPNAHLAVSSSGKVTTTGPLAVGSYSISGTDADTAGGSGYWGFTLSVTATSTAVGGPPIVVKVVPEVVLVAYTPWTLFAHQAVRLRVHLYGRHGTVRGIVKLEFRGQTLCAPKLTRGVGHCTVSSARIGRGRHYLLVNYAGSGFYKPLKRRVNVYVHDTVVFP